MESLSLPHPLPRRATTVTSSWGTVPAISPRACVWPCANPGAACFQDRITRQLTDVIKSCFFVLFLLLPYLFLLGSASSNSQAPFPFHGSHVNRKVHGQTPHIYVEPIFTGEEDCGQSPASFLVDQNCSACPCPELVVGSDFWDQSLFTPWH